jgi:uncharacterized cupredoxin-like copper-binding protein
MKARRTLLAPLAAFALAFGLAACGNGDDGVAADDGSMTVVGTEFEFSPEQVSIPADTPTEITLDNQGAVEHDWTIDELDVHVFAEAGESVIETVTAPAGTYEVYCAVVGHREAGMEGTLVVEG